MLRKFLVLFLAVASLASCKKDKDDAPAYYYSAKVDGTSTNFFNSTVTAIRIGDGILVTGSGRTTTSPYPSLGIIFEHLAAITAKTYTASAGEVTIIYQAAAGQVLYSSDDDFTVIVSSVSATEVKGTFSGKVDNGTEAKTITEGQFLAKFQ
jgi:hypothetical protein